MLAPAFHRLRRRALVPLAVLAVVSAAGRSGAAQDEALAARPAGRKYPPRIYRTVRLAGVPPAIDGRLDDEAWKEGEWAGNYTQQTPSEGAAASVRTELKILYDDAHLYVAIRAYDEPPLVHRYPGRRDDLIGDVVGVCFNSYNDKKTGFEFDLTAGGSKIDLVLGNGENEWDTSWDAVWDGEVAHDAEGWTAEFRIPLNQLRYGPEDEQVWGMHAWRWVDRNQEEDQWQLIPRKNSGRMYNLGELHGIRSLPRSRHVELLPHVVARRDSGPLTPGSSALGGSLGLDAKVGLTSNFTLDATVNPDFGQVEADPSVINLTAYETFYDEKRPFFLEGKKILSFGIEDSDQLFYSRRIGQAPAYTPSLGDGETIQMPDSTTILGAVKLTGKTNGGLSIGVLQGLTQKEQARVSSPYGTREPVVEPFGSYTVGRLHKDWDKGNTSLGAMVTETHRFISDPALAFLPTNALSAGVDFVGFFANRAWTLEARGVVSRVEGAREAIAALQRDPVHYYQRPDAGHLGVDPNATSLSGHGGSLLFGRSGEGRLRLTDHFHWYSPGLELNDLGYLKQADLLANQVFLGWEEPTPHGILRSYAAQVAREDKWDFGGLATNATTSLDLSGVFTNKWSVNGRLAYDQVVDTRALRGGPALRWHDYYTAILGTGSDPSRRVSLTLQGEHSGSSDDDSRSSKLTSELQLRLSSRLSTSARLGYETLVDNLQYVTTAESADGPRYLLARIARDTWDLTFRVNLSLTPGLTVQLYGSPFVGTGRYTDFKRGTATLARRYADRFHAIAAEEIAYRSDANAYDVNESGGSYSFANPDFSFRQFRSNLVVRWEFRPGSSVYVVWSQGRTDGRSVWESSFSRNWDSLWTTRPQNVFLVKLSYWFSP